MIFHIVGARPNFMKAAPVLDALRRQAGVQQTLVHASQRYVHIAETICWMIY